MSQVPGRTDKILIVDDDVRIRDLLRRYLTQEGFDVVQAEDGKALTRVLLREAVDLIVLDLMMPEVNGFDVVEGLQGDPATARIPILVVTGKAVDDDDRARLNGRVAAILAKTSFDTARFVAEVRRAVAGRRVGG